MNDLILLAVILPILGAICGIVSILGFGLGCLYAQALMRERTG